MSKVIKGIGKVVSAPVRGIGHALATSGIPLVSNVGGAAESLGNAVAGKGSFFGDIGRAGQAAAPVAGLIPGVGPLIGAGLGAGGTLLAQGKKAKFGDVAGRAAGGAASGYLGNKLLGGKGLPGLFQSGGLGQVGQGFGDIGSDIGGIAGKIGGILKPAVETGGKFDITKALGLGGGIANMIGSQQQRKSAQDYSNAEIDQRNKLLSMILGGTQGQNYKMSTYDNPNLNQQSTATSGGY